MPNFMLPDSDVINGQLVAVQRASAWNPITFGPFYQGGVTPVPSVPPGAYGMGSVPQDTAGTTSGAQIAAAGANPWSPKVSPLPFVIVALIVGLLGLRYVHWQM